MDGSDGNSDDEDDNYVDGGGGGREESDIKEKVTEWIGGKKRGTLQDLPSARNAVNPKRYDLVPSWSLVSGKGEVDFIK